MELELLEMKEDLLFFFWRREQREETGAEVECTSAKSDEAEDVN